MTSREAMKIFLEGKNRQGKIDDIIVIISPSDIKANIRDNGYKLNISYIQDLTSIHHITRDHEMCQGHSLEEVTLDF